MDQVEDVIKVFRDHHVSLVHNMNLAKWDTMGFRILVQWGHHVGHQCMKVLVFQGVDQILWNLHHGMGIPPDTLMKVIGKEIMMIGIGIMVTTTIPKMTIIGILKDTEKESVTEKVTILEIKKETETGVVDKTEKVVIRDNTSGKRPNLIEQGVVIMKGEEINSMIEVVMGMIVDMKEEEANNLKAEVEIVKAQMMATTIEKGVAFLSLQGDPKRSMRGIEIGVTLKIYTEQMMITEDQKMVMIVPMKLTIKYVI